MKVFAFRVLAGIIFIFLFESIIFSQEGVFKLNWIENGEKTFKNGDDIRTLYYLRFDGAIYTGENLIPEFYRTISLENYNNEQYKVSSVIYEPVPDSLLTGIPVLSDLIPSSPETMVYKGGNDYYLDIHLNAIRYNSESNSLERLVKFQLEKVTPQSSLELKSDSYSIKAASNSLLATGYWYKISISKTGIYKLTYSDLEGMGFTNLPNVRIFGYGGKQLGFFNNESRPTDLTECPVYMNRGSDGVFNSGDYILFYAEGSVVWNYDSVKAVFQQKLHDYSNHIFYFITTDHGVGKRIEQVNNSSLVENLVVNSYTDYGYYEKNLKNLIESGRTWYTETIYQNIVDTSFTFSNILPSSEVRVLAKVAGHSGGIRDAYLLVNDELVKTVSFPSVDLYYGWKLYAYDKYFDYSFISQVNTIKTGIKYQRIDLSDLAFLDYITVNVRCNLRVNKTPFFFRDNLSIGENNIARFVVDQVPTNALVWDISDINNVFAVGTNFSGNSLEFKAKTNMLKEYVLVDPSFDYPRPDIDPSIMGVGQVENQNLRALPSCNYIILAIDEFSEQAERLAEYHRENSGLSVSVIAPDKIYNEFSSGTPDVSALRDFIRHQYKLSSGNDRLKYVLLFGDGSFINHMNVEGNTNYILTYQSENSLDPTVSYVTDDFFGLLDDGEGEAVGKLDIGIGRLPLKLVDGNDIEAEQVVDKILSYYNSEMSDWRRTLCFLGDDQNDGGYTDGDMHMWQADSLATYVQTHNSGFEVKKIMLDAYKQVTSASGPTYPEAKQDLMDAFNKGVLIFNYNGHGGENGITGEKLLLTSDILSMKNYDHLPLFITATCEFSRFDDVAMKNNKITPKTTAGEWLILNPEGGGVASFTTTRVVYAENNYNLNHKIVEVLFSSDNEGNPYRLGDVLRLAKNKLSDQNKLNFTLLGDPAMILKYPRYKILTDSINHKSINSQIDTIKAFGEVTVSGYVAFEDSTLISDFNGLVYPTVYDKSVEITTLGNDGEKPYKYQEQKNLIYKGKATVKDGRFTFSFIVPKDISYSLGQGKISYYAENKIIDAKGETKKIVIGGTNPVEKKDNNGPEIELFMNDERFEDGGMTNRNPYIYARLYDTNGINTTGVGIGHDIMAVLDWDDLRPYILNDYFEADVDNFRSGTVSYKLSDLEEGEHFLSMKVWDVFNNSSIAEIGFVVEISDGLILEELLNYPNPASDYTYFQYTHNFPGEEHQITLDIFDLSGRLVSSISRTMYESGFVSEPLRWDRASGSNLRAGIYPYRLSVTTSGGTSYISQKLIINR